MTFEQSLEKIVEKTGIKQPFETDSDLRTAMTIWNMVAFALKEKSLDDLVVIRNNNFESIPLSEGKTDVKEKTEKSGKTGKEPKSESATE